MTDKTEDVIKLLAIPLDEISPEEMEQLRKFAEEQDWNAMRQQLIHYSKRYKETQSKGDKS
jgi:inorganic pyrophosphatase